MGYEDQRNCGVRASILLMLYTKNRVNWSNTNHKNGFPSRIYYAIVVYLAAFVVLVNKLCGIDDRASARMQADFMWKGSVT